MLFVLGVAMVIWVVGEEASVGRGGVEYGSVIEEWESVMVAVLRRKVS